MIDPFKLIGRILIASFQIMGYCISYGGQMLWYIFHGRRDKIGDATGELGRSITDAIAGIFK